MSSIQNPRPQTKNLPLRIEPKFQLLRFEVIASSQVKLVQAKAQAQRPIASACCAGIESIAL
jgi:hypothetical protein